MSVRMDCPSVGRVRDERDPVALVAEATALLPLQPPFVDRDAARKPARAFRPHSTRSFAVALRGQDRFGPELNGLQARQPLPDLARLRIDADRGAVTDHSATLAGEWRAGGEVGRALARATWAARRSMIIAQV